MVFDALRRALGNDGPERLDEVQREIARLDEAIARRTRELHELRSRRLQTLFPDGPVPGSGEGRYPGLDPVNFEEDESQGWLISAATGIIDNFPGSEALLSQLDSTLAAFADANHLRVTERSPYAHLLAWSRDILERWDLERSAPLYLSNGKGSLVLGCKNPLIVLDRQALDALDSEEQRFLLAATLGHLFFGNLRLFAFYRLMGILDKLPSMTGAVTRGLGMIPGIGNTISRGFELVRTLNNQVVRKTNLVIGLRQHVLCDRLATLALGSPQPALRYLARTALGGQHALEPEVLEQLVDQGRALQRRYDAGEVDLNMLSVIGPGEAFAAWRAFKLSAWLEEERSQKLFEGYYVTRERLDEHRRADRKMEEAIGALETRLLELHKRQGKLREELQGLLARHEEASEEKPED